MTILALYSNKGGVGKTAAAVNLAYLAAQSGRKTLLCDLDPQGAATYYFRIKPKVRRKARGLAKGGKQIDRSIKGSDYAGLDVLPADFSHRNLDVSFGQRKRRKHRLDIALNSLREQYDLIVLDCPPTIDIVAENIFNVSDILLVPVTPTTLSVHSYDQLRRFIDDSRGGRDRTAVFLSMVDRRKKLHRQLAGELREQLEGMLDSAIPYATEVEQMGIYREPLPAYSQRSRATKAYRALWSEVAEKLLAPLQLA